MDYWGVSQFKAFDRCEAAGLAMARGEYEREYTTSLLVGSYVDTYFTGTEPGALGRFALDHPEIFTKSGALKSEFRKADELIHRIKADPLMMKYLAGEYQVIATAELFDVPWKIKMDVHGGNRIVDLKIVKDFKPLYQEGYGYRSWIEYWGYDIQGAIYQRVEQIASGRTQPLPFYLVAATKETVPDIDIIQIPQHILDAALKVVESKIDRFDLVKHGDIQPVRCEKCDYCKQTKVIREPSIYEIEEA